MAKRNTNTTKPIETTEQRRYPPHIAKAICAVVLFAVSLCVLEICERDYLWMLGEQSIYLNTEPFWNSMAHYSVWPMLMFGKWATQIFAAMPWAGCMIVASLLTLQYVILSFCIKGCDGKYGWLAFPLPAVPPLVSLCAVHNIDYAVYDHLDGAVYLITLLGMTIVCISLLLSMMRDGRFGIFVAVALALLSPVIGVFSFFGAIVVAVCGVANKNRREMIAGAVAVLLYFAVVYIEAEFVYFEKYQIAFLAPLPDVMFGGMVWISIAAMLLVGACAYVFKRLCATDGANGLTAREIVLSTVGILALFAIFRFASYTDENFYTELCLQKLESERRYEDIIVEASKAENPTQTIVDYKSMAQLVTKEYLEKAFDIAPFWRAYNTSHFTDGAMIHWSAMDLTFGMPNAALYGAMELWQLSGMKIVHLKGMVRSYAMIGDWETVRRLLRIIETGWGYRDFCKQWKGYCDDPKKMFAEDTRLRRCKEAEDMSFGTFLGGDSRSKFIDRELIQKDNTAMLRLYASLYMRNLDRMSNDMVVLSPMFEGRPVPKYVQEACVVCEIAGDLEPIKRIKVSEDIYKRVHTAVDKARSYGNRRQAAEKMRKRYHADYIYYYLFSEMDGSFYKGEDIDASK